MLKNHMKMFSWLLAVGLVGFLGFGVQVRAASLWPFEGEPLADSIKHTYGDVQEGMLYFDTGDSAFLRYLHTGLDIYNPAMTGIIASDTGFLSYKRFTSKDNDTAFYAIGIGTSPSGDCPGWMYTHVDPAIVDTWDLGHPVPRGFHFSHVWYFPSRQSNTFPHLHFERVWGWGMGNHTQGFFGSPGGGGGICGPQGGYGWDDKHMYVIANPLDYLESKSDTIPPFINVRNPYSPFYLKRDSTEYGTYTAYRKLYRPYYPYYPDTTYRRDSVFVVNRKADVSARINDFIRSHTWFTGPYKVFYEVHSANGQLIQGPKGFKFTGWTLTPGLNDTVNCRLIANRVYDPDSTRPDSLKFFYLMSNADSIANDFDSLALGRQYVPEALKGYWSTKQHKDRAWNEDESATQDSARFKDGYYWVKVQTWDSGNNTDCDSLKVIVNNFPPQVKQTYPDSGGVNFVSGDSIRILFDQPMDTASAKAAFHLQLKGSGSDVAGDTLFSGDTLLIFAPSETLLLDTVYVVKIDATAKDIADSTMLNPYEFPFSTQRTVLLFSVRDGANSISIQQFDSTATETLHVYQRYTGIGPTTGPMMCYDRQGNNYIVHWASVMGVNCVSKFSYSGDSLGRFLVGRKYRSITTDGDSLFLLQRSPTDTTRYQYILKTSLSGDSGGCFFMSSAYGWTSSAVWYNPWDSLLYVTWNDTTQAHSGTAFVRKYQRDSVQVGNDLQTSNTHGLQKLIVVNDRVAMIRAYPGTVLYNSYVTFHRLSDWNNPFDVDLSLYDPYGGVPWVLGATASPTHLYVTARSYLGTPGSFGHWIARFDRNGNFLDALVPPDGNNTFCGAMAAFPPAIRFPKATYTPPDNGDDGGGSQSAELNSLLPRAYALGQCYPNPTKEGLRIDYALPKESQVSLRIYNVAGQLVRTLREGKEKPGFYKAEWDGQDQQGRRVASGVYLYRMEAGEFRKTRKLVVLN